MLLTQVERLKTKDKTTEGIFAPWAFYKSDFQEIGGHDPIFAPQSKEDTDIFNRFHLNGCKFIQTWEGFVYHMTCRGSRFADGATRNPNGEVFMKNRETDEWLKQNQKSTKEFLRKWGHFCKHDTLMKPIVPPKYNIGFILKNCTPQLLETLEPWCSTIYVDEGNTPTIIKNYINLEQPNTSFDLQEKIKPYDNEKNNEILVTIDGSKFTQQDFQIIQQLSEILANDKQLHEDFFVEPTQFTIENLQITITNLNTYEKDLICVRTNLIN